MAFFFFPPLPSLLEPGGFVAAPLWGALMKVQLEGPVEVPGALFSPSEQRILGEKKPSFRSDLDPATWKGRIKPPLAMHKRCPPPSGQPGFPQEKKDPAQRSQHLIFAVKQN